MEKKAKKHRVIDIIFTIVVVLCFCITSLLLYRLFLNCFIFHCILYYNCFLSLFMRHFYKTLLFVMKIYYLYYFFNTN